MDKKIQPVGDAKGILKFARASSKLSSLVFIDVVETGIVLVLVLGFWQKFMPSKGFLIQELGTCIRFSTWHFKVPGVSDSGLKPRREKKVSIIGGWLWVLE